MPDSEAASDFPASDPLPPTNAPLPEFLNPESAHYQPWAEKQISNATKDKRPLSEYMAEMEVRLNGYGDLPAARWDPQRQERLLSRFAVPVPARPKRRRRRRSAAPTGGARPQSMPGRPQSPAAGPVPARRPKPGAPPSANQRPPAAAGEAGASAKRRRRRRRSRGGSGSAATTPPA